MIGVAAFQAIGCALWGVPFYLVLRCSHSRGYALGVSAVGAAALYLLAQL